MSERPIVQARLRRAVDWVMEANSKANHFAANGSAMCA